MVKRIISLMLCLAMLLGLGLTAPAQAQAGSVDLFAQDETRGANSMVIHKGELLVRAQYGLYAYKDGDEAPRLLVSLERNYFASGEEEADYFDTLLAEGEQLYGYQMQSGKLYPLTLEADKLVYGQAVTLDLSTQKQDQGDEYTYINQPEQMLMDGGRLYMVFKTYDQGGPKTSLLSFDLQTGAMTPVDAPHVQRLSSYKDGQLLALVLDEANAWNARSGEVAAPMIAALDPKTGRLSDIGPSPYAFSGSGLGLVYDAASDSIYLLGSAEISRRDAQGQTQVCAYLSSSQLWGFSAGQLLLLGQDRIAVGSMDGIYLRGTDPSQLPSQRLTIYGSYESPTHRKAARAMNEIPLSFPSTKWFSTAQELGQALVSGEDDIDLLFLTPSQIDLDMLMRKGYAADLSGSQILKDFVAKTYPQMQKVGSLDGKLMLVPVEVNPQAMGYFPKVFEKVGAKVPESFPELVDLIDRWSSDYAQEHPDVIPMAEASYGQYLLLRALYLYRDYSGYTGEEFSFSSPMLMEMMRLALSADTKDLDSNVDMSSPEAQTFWNELYNREQLLEGYGNLDPQMLTQITAYQDEGHSFMSSPLVISAKEGGPKITQLSLTLMMVNPKSKHLDVAIRYAENYVKSLDGKTLLMLDPSLNEPVEEPEYDKMLKQMDEGLESFEKAVAAAEGADKTQMEEQLASVKADMDKQKERMRWQVTADAIKEYRGYLETSYVPGYDLQMIFSVESMQKLLTRLINKQIPLEQFANEADGMLRLMRLENQ